MRSTLIAGLAFACAACAAVPGKGPIVEYKLDQVIPLTSAEDQEVSFKSGPFELVNVKVRNPPSAEDVARATDKPWDMSHPKPIVTVHSSAQHTARVTLVSMLEDASGKPLMVCKSRLDQELAPGIADDWNTCQLEGIRTVDWPRVKSLHAVLTFQVREGASAAEQGKPTGEVVEGVPPHCGGQPTPKDCE